MELLLPSLGLLFWTLMLPLFLLWVVALADILRQSFRGAHEKLIWVLVVLFAPLIGAILYFIIGRQNRIKK